MGTPGGIFSELFDKLEFDENLLITSLGGEDVPGGHNVGGSAEPEREREEQGQKDGTVLHSKCYSKKVQGSNILCAR